MTTLAINPVEDIAAAAPVDHVWRRVARSGRIVIGGGVLFAIIVISVATLPWTLDTRRDFTEDRAGATLDGIARRTDGEFRGALCRDRRGKLADDGPRGARAGVVPAKSAVYRGVQSRRAERMANLHAPSPAKLDWADHG